MLAEFPDTFLELDAAALVMIAATPGHPMVASTILPDRTFVLLDLIVNHGDWPNSVQTSDKLH